MHHSSGFMNLIHELQENVQEKNINQVKKLIDSSAPNLILVDVRETEEWDEGYIPGAIHLSKGILERDIEKVIPDKNAELILYCRGGYRSIIAASSLLKMGYTNVTSMSGGISAWQQADLPVEYD